MLQKMEMSFLNFFSKFATIWIFSKLQVFLITNIKKKKKKKNHEKNPFNVALTSPNDNVQV